jgi:ABC-type glycerol-3-phosphate transport system substrate-binding protein
MSLSNRGKRTGLSRREFLSTSLKAGLGLAIGSTLVGTGCRPAEDPETEVQTGASTPALARDPVVLDFWQISQGVTFQGIMAQAIRDFEDSHPNIRVRITEQAANDLRTQLRPVFADGGPGPDVVMEGAVQTLTYAGMPFGFADLTDRIRAAGIDRNTPEAVWAPIAENNSMYGVPLDAFPFYLIYNKDLYEAAGISRPPETWDELLNNAVQLTDPARDTFGFITYTDRFASWVLETLWYNSGVGYFEGSEDFRSYDITRPITVARPEAIASLEYKRQLAETAPGGIQGNFGLGTSDIRARFGRGNLGHFFTHSIHVSQIQDDAPDMVPLQNFGVVAFPAGPERRGTCFSTSVLGVTKNAKDQDAAWEFVQHLSDKWEGFLAPSVGTVPVRQDVAIDDNAHASWLLPIGREAMAGDLFPQAFFPQLDAFRLPMADNVQAYFLGQKTAEEAMRDTAEQAESALTG